MEWWESTEEYNPGASLWRGRKISSDTSSCESDIEIIEDKAAPKDKVRRRNLFTCLAVLVNDASKGYFIHSKNQIIPVLS